VEWKAVAFAIALAGCNTSGDGVGDGASGSTESGSTTSATAAASTSTGDGSTRAETDDPIASSSGTTASSGSESTTGAPACRPEPRRASYIWIANAGPSTVSKIHTGTMVEEARYLTRADAAGDPSQTSVDFNGDVAVANRNGGVTVFAGDAEHCPDPRATSSGGDDVRSFPDGCLRWEHAFDYTRQHPVAWTQGRWDEEQCRWVDIELWTSGTDGATLDVLLLDGATGNVMQTIPIDGVDPGADGLFAAAVDGNGDFWGAQVGNGSLVHVAREDFEVRTYAQPVTAYGLAVDPDGNVWTCWQDAARFDPVLETWELFLDAGGAGSCNLDRYGVLWIANDPLVGLGVATGTVLYTIDLPAYTRAVAVDGEDRVWAVEVLTDPGHAYRIDPASGEIETLAGLELPYAGGDPTGLALQFAGP
jgi:hypothetical protein